MRNFLSALVLVSFFNLFCGCAPAGTDFGKGRDSASAEEQDTNPAPDTGSEPDAPNSGCTANADCGEGQRCDIDTRECVDRNSPRPEPDAGSEPEPDAEPEVVDSDRDGSPEGEDCDDSDANRAPDLTEICDGIDNDCDGDVDELEECTRDEDGDRIPAFEDCDDHDAQVFPGAEEVCNGVDDNCDGNVDEGLEAETFYRDLDDDGFGDQEVAEEACIAPEGYITRGGDCDDRDGGIHPGAAEICDGLDNNCNEQVDEGLRGGPWFRDGDDDGQGNPTTRITTCVAPEGYVDNGYDCDDTDPEVYFGAEEVCGDGIDNDCVGGDLLPTRLYVDCDADTYGAQGQGIEFCPNDTLPGNCSWVARSGDCNDRNAAINPRAAEICDGAGVDENCDGVIDAQRTFYRDGDGDDFGLATDTRNACATPEGYTLTAGDCDDENAQINPGAREICDTLDNDCDGNVDEGVTQTFYADADEDGYGDPNQSTQACTQPSGHVRVSEDCDDTDPTVNPDGVEICGDGIDQDCVLGDLACTPEPPVDSDGDGFGDDVDCNDGNANINPDATEICGNGIDEDCAGGDATCPDPDPEPDPEPDVDPFEGADLIFVADLNGDGDDDSLCISSRMFREDVHREAPAHIVGTRPYDSQLDDGDIIQLYENTGYFCRDFSEDADARIRLTLVSTISIFGDGSPDAINDSDWAWLQNQDVCNATSQVARNFCRGTPGNYLFSVAVVDGVLYPHGYDAPPLPE